MANILRKMVFCKTRHQRG